MIIEKKMKRLFLRRNILLSTVKKDLNNLYLKIFWIPKSEMHYLKSKNGIDIKTNMPLKKIKPPKTSNKISCL
jgi:hypothetical protein